MFFSYGVDLLYICRGAGHPLCIFRCLGRFVFVGKVLNDLAGVIKLIETVAEHSLLPVLRNVGPQEQTRRALHSPARETRFSSEAYRIDVALFRIAAKPIRIYGQIVRDQGSFSSHVMNTGVIRHHQTADAMGSFHIWTLLRERHLN